MGIINSKPLTEEEKLLAEKRKIERKRIEDLEKKIRTEEGWRILKDKEKDMRELTRLKNYYEIKTEIENYKLQNCGGKHSHDWKEHCWVSGCTRGYDEKMTINMAYYYNVWPAVSELIKKHYSEYITKDYWLLNDYRCRSGYRPDEFDLDHSRTFKFTVAGRYWECYEKCSGCDKCTKEFETHVIALSGLKFKSMEEYKEWGYFY